MMLGSSIGMNYMTKRVGGLKFKLGQMIKY